MILIILGIAVFFIAFIGLCGFRIIDQYERAVRLRFGSYKDTLTPGLRWVIPLVDSLTRVDIRQRTIDLESQDVMTNDQVNLTIDGVVFYVVENSANSVLNVTDVRKQLADKATGELKEIVGDLTMSETLSKREEIAKKLVTRLTKAIKDESAKKEDNKNWGITVKAVQINNVNLPRELIRAMSKQAEAEREKQARKTKAEGEKEASEKFKEASDMYKGNPIALRLRELQTYQEIGIEQNTMMMVIPTDMVTAGNANWLLAMGKKPEHTAKKKK